MDARTAPRRAVDIEAMLREGVYLGDAIVTRALGRAAATGRLAPFTVALLPTDEVEELEGVGRRNDAFDLDRLLGYIERARPLCVIVIGLVPTGIGLKIHESGARPRVFVAPLSMDGHLVDSPRASDAIILDGGDLYGRPS